MNLPDVCSNRKEINELMRYSCGSLGTSGCVTRGVMFINAYNGMCVSQGTWGVKKKNSELMNEQEIKRQLPRHKDFP